MASSSQSTRKDTTLHFSRHDESGREPVSQVTRVTWAGMGVNIALALAKSAAGLLAQSHVLLADAAHTVSDLATDAAILVGVRFWSAPADAEHPHGHRKIETLITLGIGIALALVGLGLGYEAVAHLASALAGHAPGRPPEAGTPVGWALYAALATAGASIAIKEWLYRWTAAKGAELGSSALCANAWHHRSDALSSIPPLLAIGGEAAGARLGFDVWYLDPVGTIVVCVMLLQAAWDVTRPTLGALLDASADRRMCSAIRRTVLTTSGVIDTHKIRTRVLCSNTVAVDLHITVDKNLSVESGHTIATEVTRRLQALAIEDCPRAVDVIVHVEPGDASSKRLPGAPGRDTLVDWKQRE